MSLFQTEGRGISVGPLFGSDGKSDIVISNVNSYYIGSSTFRHKGNSAVFRNNGDGTFTDFAESLSMFIIKMMLTSFSVTMKG